MKKRTKQTPQEQTRRHNLRANHNISVAEYERYQREQKSMCAICGHRPEPGEQRLAVDHCHKSGHIRGLLCKFCNIGLGCFRDDTYRLECAITYLVER